MELIPDYDPWFLDGWMDQVSSSGGLYTLDISADGNHFVTGGADKLLKVLTYNEGEVTHIGQGHSDNITAVAASPDQEYIISVTAAGSIFRWKYPHASFDVHG